MIRGNEKNYCLKVDSLMMQMADGVPVREFRKSNKYGSPRLKSSSARVSQMQFKASDVIEIRG